MELGPFSENHPEQPSTDGESGETMDNSQNPINWPPENRATATPPETMNEPDPVGDTRFVFAGMSSDEQRKFIYTYQPPREDQVPKFIAVQAALLEAAKVVEENCPRCADRSHALRLLRDVRMWANAAIALDGVV